MARIREVSFVTPGRVAACLVAVISVLGVLLVPAVSDAAPTSQRTTTTRRVRTTTTTIAVLARNDIPTLAIDQLPSSAAPVQESLAVRTITPPVIDLPNIPGLPNITQFLQNILATINQLLRNTFANLCHTLGPPFCASP